MKIREVNTYVIREELDTPFGMSQWYWKARANCLVEIVIDNGIIGWGECFGPAEPAKALIDSVYAPQLMNQDPLESVSLWEKLYNQNREWGRKGISIAALSGIEIALLDVAGKAMDRPIFQILGGKRPACFETYASGFYYGGPWEDNIEAEANELRSKGYKHVKMKVGADLEWDIERVRRARQALGPDIAIAVDANRGYTPAEAVTFGRAVSDCGIWFFEEPVIPENVDAYKEVRAKLDIPIAGGESEFTRWGFRNLLESRAVDILQPDATACGGIRETLHIAAMASAYGIPVLPHVWGSSITIAAGLHLATALPNVTPSMGRKPVVIEVDQSPNVFREGLGNLTIGTTVEVPEGPGLGIQIDRSIIERYAQ